MTYHRRVRAIVPETCVEIDRMVTIIAHILTEANRNNGNPPSVQLCEAFSETIANMAGDVVELNSLLNPLREANQKLRDALCGALERMNAASLALQPDTQYQPGVSHGAIETAQKILAMKLPGEA